MTQLSYEQVRDEFKQLVDENPDFVYRPPNGSDCFYVHVDGDNMTPGCIVGHWLHRFRGIPLYRLQGIEGNGAAPGASILGVRLSSKAGSFLSGLQTKQDSGIPWRMAFDMAVEDEAAFGSEGDEV